jgi:hypothetical protein
LFRGVPGSALSTPLIPDGKISDVHKAYVDNLLSQRYMDYVIEVQEENVVKLSSHIRATVRVSVNYNSLRNDLGNQQVIRKFGY